MTLVDGLSFGVLKEQEFKFKSKLNTRLRANSLQESVSSNPATVADKNKVPAVYKETEGRLNTIREEDDLYQNKENVQQQQVKWNKGYSGNTTYSSAYSKQRFSAPAFNTLPPVVDTTHLQNLAHLAAQRDSQFQQKRRNNAGINSKNTISGTNNFNINSYAAATAGYRNSRHFSFAGPSTKSSAASRFNKQHAAQFISGDPQSDRLSEFVSKMVFYIFWSGSDSYEVLLSGQTLGQVPFQFNLVHKATDDFIYYTKYLLETMQVSCSTALLSLFYLHRLRPRVKHLFVPGTFPLPLTPPEGKFQYRRDPKLEYRLFTIALILANKYLDDNSYSNKAWSEVTGLELRKINIMESEFMKYIDYGLLVKEREYVVWVRWLEMFIRYVMDSGSQNGSVPKTPTF